MNLLNEWIGYVDRGYEQMMQSITDRMAAYVPEITDRSDSNPWIKSARIFAGIGEMLGFYVNAAAREAFLPTARNYSSAVKFAALVDYRIRGTLPASADLLFSVPNAEAVDTTVPVGTIVKTVGGLAFVTLQDGVLRAGTTQVLVPAQNWRQVQAAALGTSDGSAGQKFPLEAGVVDGNITLNVGLSPVAWVPVDTFAYSTTADKHFRASVNEAQVLTVEFGDGTSGQVPAAGLSVVATYYLSDGAAGNVAPGTLTELSGLSTPGGQTLRVTNPQRASGGDDAEGLEVLRKRIPLSLRTLERAVTSQDYIDVALLAPGVAQAGIVYNCGKLVEVYVAPNGGGVASSALTAAVEAYFDPRRMVTTQVKAYAAGEVHLLLNIFVQVKPNYYRAATLAAAQARVLSFLSVSQQKINGSVEIGDVYEVLENTEGVQFSRINLLTARPSSRPLGHAQVLDWTVAVQPDSRAATRWRITVQPSGLFELIEGTTYRGQFPAGQLQQYPQVEFTIAANAGYQSGQAWEFVTYPYSGSIYLSEQSVPVAAPADLTLTASGGLV